MHYQSKKEIGICCPAGFEDGKRGHEPRNIGSFYKDRSFLKKGKELELLEGMQPCPCLDFRPISDL